jgi:hypothetical protein
MDRDLSLAGLDHLLFLTNISHIELPLVFIEFVLRRRRFCNAPSEHGITQSLGNATRQQKWKIR